MVLRRLALRLEQLVVAGIAALGSPVDLAVVEGVQTPDAKMGGKLRRLGQLDGVVTVLMAVLLGALAMQEGVQLRPEVAAVVRVADAKDEGVLLVLRLRPQDVPSMVVARVLDVELSVVDRALVADADMDRLLMRGRSCQRERHRDDQKSACSCRGEYHHPPR
jgi:hypothetical protein